MIIKGYREKCVDQAPRGSPAPAKQSGCLPSPLSRRETQRYTAAIVAFGLYIHIPYCRAKCPYCDFNSHAAERWPEADYVHALGREFDHYAQQSPWCSSTIGTVFFGGGTPSLFAPESIAKILNAVFTHWCPAAPAAVEVTLEANPGTVTLERLRALRVAGINRLSIGVQSFHAHHLRRLGRIHDGTEAVAAVELARQAGFASVGIDLIFALPEQTVPEWESDLEHACQLGPDHISAYNLTYAEGTPFAALRQQGVLQPLPEDTEVALFTTAQRLLSAAGYEQYEISSYARPGHRCRHNLTYWRAGNYLGVGAGAHSFTQARGVADGDCYGRRWSNEPSPDRYIEFAVRHGHARATIEDLDARRARGEFVFLGLRCLDGFDTRDFRLRFGTDFLTTFPHASDLRDDGLLHCRGNRWHLTRKGLLLADSVFATFV